MGDVAFALAPVTLAEAQAMLSRTWAGRRLAGVRGARAANQEAVLDALAAIEGLMRAHPELLEFEVNPLIVTPDDAWAVDVRLSLAPTSGQRALASSSPT